MRSSPPPDGLAVEVELKKQKWWLDYHVTSQVNGGATIAARLLCEDLLDLRKEVDRLVRSLEFTRRSELKQKQ
jgi:hypothetical protein